MSTNNYINIENIFRILLYLSFILILIGSLNIIAKLSFRCNKD